jgi:hypothetical protein
LNIVVVLVPLRDDVEARAVGADPPDAVRDQPLRRIGGAEGDDLARVEHRPPVERQGHLQERVEVRRARVETDRSPAGALRS